MFEKSKLSLIVGAVAIFGIVTAACAPSAAPQGDSESREAAMEKGTTPQELAKPGEIAPAAGGATQSEEAGAMEAKGQRGGVLLTSTATRINADPAIGQTPYNVWYFVGEPMVRRNIKTYALEPATFESWDISADGKEITFKVRQGMKWHNKPPVNGRDVEAKDLVYVLNSASGRQYPDQPAVRFPRAGSYLNVEDVVAVDKQTVKVTLKAPSVSFLHGLADYRATWAYPDGLREHFGGFDSLTVGDPDRHIGAGPWTLDEHKQDVQFVFKRNPDYYDPEKPYIEEVRRIYIRDTSTQQAAFVAGKLSVLGTTREAQRNYVVENYKEANIITYEPNSCWYRVSLNTQRKPFDDNRVRKALYLVIDKGNIGKAVSGNWQGKPLWVWPGVIPFVFPEARPQEELAQHKYMQGPTPENVAEARELMQEAGYESGFEFDMHVSRSMIDDAQLIEQDWTTHLPGVKATIKSVDSETHRTLAAQGEYDAQLYCHIFDVTAVAHVTNAYHSKGGRNYGRNNDPDLDAILDEAERALDPDKYKELMRKAEDHIYENSLAMLPHRQYYSQVAIAPKLKGFSAGPATSYYVNARDWWWEQ